MDKMEDLHLDRMIKLACAFIIVVLIFAGCSASSQMTEEEDDNDKVTLEAWIFFDQNTPGTHYFDTWEALEAELGYDITVKTFSTEELKDKLRISLASKELPDIFAVWGGTFPDFLINAEACLPVQDYINESDLNFKPSYLVPYSDGNNYIIPCLVEAYAVTYCNNTLMAEVGVTPPKTWEELLAFIDAVTLYNSEHGTDYAAMELGDKDNWLGDLLYTMIVNRMDPYALDKLMSGEMSFSEGKLFLEAAYKVRRLVEKGAFPKDFLDTGEVESIENFIKGEALLFPHQSTIVYHLMDHMGKDGISLVQFPDLSLAFNPNYSRYMIDINHTLTPGLCISSHTAYPDEAAKLCLAFADRVNRVNVSEYGYINITDDDSLVPPENLPTPVVSFQTMLEDAEHYTSFWYALMPQNDGNAWRSLTKKLYAGALTPEEFISEGDQYIESLSIK